MSVLLSPQTEAMIRERVENGGYLDADTAVQEALRLLEEHEGWRWLQHALAEGDEGEAIELTEERLAQIRQRAIDGARAGTPISDAVTP
jgi:putative addiction module CopG family antidote